MIVSVGDFVAELRSQLRIDQRHSAVHRDRVSSDVGRIVGERAEGERVLVHIARIANHCLDEIAGPDIVQEIGKEVTAERVVPKILNDRATIRICARFQNLRL